MMADTTPPVANQTPPEATASETPSPANTSPTQPTPVAPQAPANGLAIAALVVGIVAFVSGWIPVWGILAGAAAVVLGILGLKKAGGKGMAIAGLVTGGLGALWGLMVTAFFVIALVAVGTTATTYQQEFDKQTEQNQAIIDAKKDFAKGETAIFADKFEVKVNSSQPNYNPGEYYKAAEGKQYLVVNVSVKNISDEDEYLSPYNFTVVDNGMSKTSTYVPVENRFETGNLQPGGTATGNIVYEITSDATDLKLQYDTTVYDKNYAAKSVSYTLAF